jgi:peptide/nickel transport system substrate-binding protein
LTVGLAIGEPDTLDPTLSHTAGAGEVYRAICEGLYDLNSKFEIVPWLAAALPVISPDKRTYTIQLRSGVLFNDGTPFDAQAVVTTLQRDLTLPGSAVASNLAAIDTVTASGPLTVVIHLKYRYSPLLTVLQQPIMSPAQLAKLGTSFGTDPVCVGPFMFDSRVAGDSVTVIKSPYYYDRLAVHLDKIVFKIETNPAAAAAQLKAGDLQALDTLSTTELPGVMQDSDLDVMRSDTLGVTWVVFNIGNKNGVGQMPYTNVGTPFASSPKLRQAFEEAIDRNTLVRVVASGNAQPGCTQIAPVDTVWYDPTIPCTPYDPADAKKLVAASGVASPTVHLLTPAGGDMRLPLFIQAEEAAVGINVVIDSPDFTTAVARAFAGNFDAYLIGNTGSLDPGVFLSNREGTSGSGNVSGYSNPRLDYILANAFKATTVRARRTLYRAAQEIVLADRPVIVLAHPIFFAATSTKVTGAALVSTSFRVAFAQLR